VIYFNEFSASFLRSSGSHDLSEIYCAAQETFLHISRTSQICWLYSKVWSV